MRLIPGTGSLCTKRTQMARRSARTPGITSLIQRLWNFAAWARDDPDTPHVSMSSVYDGWNPYGSARDAGWGEPESAPPMEQYDEDDAEVMDGWVRQLPQVHRVTIVRRFVLRHRVGHHEVDAAVLALAGMMEANWRVVDKMEGR